MLYRFLPPSGGNAEGKGGGERANKKSMNKKQTNESAAATEQQYVAPEMEIIEVETSQSLLGGSAGAPDMPGEEW